MTRKNITTRQVKELIRHPYAWPGGYEVLFITNDGEILCHNCARQNWREICDSMTHKINDGWRIVGYATMDNDIEATDESPLYCAHCNKEWTSEG